MLIGAPEHEVASYEEQLEGLLENTSLFYKDAQARVELYQADPSIFIFNTFEGPFLKNVDVFDYTGIRPDFTMLLAVMETAAPLAQWDIK